MNGAASLFDHPERVFVGGAWVAAASDRQFSVVDPSTEREAYRVAEAVEADIDAAVEAARRAFDDGPWPRMSPGERAQHLRRLADELRLRAKDLAAVWTTETGVVQTFAEERMPALIDVYDYYADLGDTHPFIEMHDPLAGGAGYLVREPVGCVGAIVPWNAPFSLMTYKVAPALVAGCTVVVKFSPEAPGTGYVFAEAVRAAGIPAGVVNMVCADREASERLVTDPRIDKISFTGSTAAGRRIASLCGQRIARVTLELGGKSAAIVLDDADLLHVARSIAQSTRIMTGQVCSSLTRVIAGRSRYVELVDALGSEFARLNVGDPRAAGTDMGPLAMERQLRQVARYVEVAQAEGASVAHGGRRHPDHEVGYFFEPTVLADVDNLSTVAREEVFGPVVSVIEARDEDHAIELANQSEFGLNASVFTPDPEHAFQVARRIRSGTVGHNAFRNDFSIAFGGFKQSGLGREGGREGLLPYLESKTILLDGWVDYD